VWSGQETYWEQAGESCVEVDGFVREDSLVREDVLAIEVDADVGQVTVVV